MSISAYPDGHAAAYHLPSTGYLILERFPGGIDYVLCSHAYIELDKGYTEDPEETLRGLADKIAATNGDIVSEELDFTKTRDYYIAIRYSDPDEDIENLITEIDEM